MSEPSTNEIVTDLIAVLREGLTNVTWHARVRPALVALAVTGDAVWERRRSAHAQAESAGLDIAVTVTA